MLEDFQQWVNLKYQYQDHSSSSGTKSSSHEFLENYNAGLNFDVLNPHLLTVNLTVSLGLRQSQFINDVQGSTGGSSIRHSYAFSGSGLDRSVTPFTVNSFRNTETVLSPFSPAFTSTTTGNELQVRLLNVFLPSTFSYTRRSLDNSGAGNTSSSVSDTFGYTATHNYKDFSITGVTLSASQVSGSSLGLNSASRSYSAALNNVLQWGPNGKYALSSQAQIYENVNQDVPQRNTSISEVFHDQLGKALDLQLSYALAQTSTLGFLDQSSDTKMNSFELQLSHHLFESLTTRLRGKYTLNELLGGSETRYAGSGELAYIKKIPGNNHLSLGFAGVHEVIDNRLASPLLTVTDQPHPGVHQGDIITLPVTGLLTEVIRVRSTLPLFIYEEGTDYTVDLALGQITIVTGGRIDPSGAGTDLLISYVDFNNTDLKYASNSVKLNGAITLKSGKLALGGFYIEQWMTLIDGTPQNSLRDSTLKMLYHTGNLYPFSYRVSYSNTVIGSLDASSVDGYIQYVKDSTFGRFSLVGTERVSWFGASENTPGYSENTASVTMSALRTFFSRLRVTVAANVFDSRSDLRGAKDIFSLRTSMLFVLNKFTLTFDGQSSWNFSGQNSTREDTVSLDIARYF